MRIKKALKHLANFTANFMGSWWSVFSFLVIILSWITFNTLSSVRIDPFPYAFLNLILGVLAALTGPLVLIGNSSQDKRHQKLVQSIYAMEKKQMKEKEEEEKEKEKEK